ncbi:MAG TPA: heme ABC exporter ATP-binding protein CcmA [Alphaproteobacteria bacterium]
MDEFTGTALACVRGERLVFKDLSFRVGAGQVLALTGPNGSGKSSLLRLMAGLIRPAGGRLAWAGASVADDPDAHRARLHYLGHLDALKPALTVTENVAFYAALRGHHDAAAVDAALAAFGLSALADLPARFLSQGQRRRTALARLLAAPAPLWLLDEPTLGLDAASLDALLAVLRRHVAAGGRAVIATHVPLDVPGLDELRLGDRTP